MMDSDAILKKRNLKDILRLIHDRQLASWQRTELLGADWEGSGEVP